MKRTVLKITENILLVIAVLLSLTMLAIIIPRVFIPSNLNTYSDKERVWGAFGIERARQFVGGSTEPLFVTGYSIKNMQILISEEDGCLISPEGNTSESYHFSYSDNVTIQLYGLFGFPYNQVTVSCNRVTRH